MKTAIRTIAVLGFILPFTGAAGYTVDEIISNLENIRPTKVERVEVKKLEKGLVALEMDFAGAVFLMPSLVRSLRSATIQKVELFYTEYRASSTFDQAALNESRCRKLLKAIPQIKKNDMIAWGVTVQTAAAN